MRSILILPCAVAGIALAAWLAVHVAASLDPGHLAFAYLRAFLGIAVLVYFFVLLGESVIEDGVKAGILILLSLLRPGAVPTLVPCVVIVGAVVGSGANQLIKMRGDPRE